MPVFHLQVLLRDIRELGDLCILEHLTDVHAPIILVLVRRIGSHNHLKLALPGKRTVHLTLNIFDLLVPRGFILAHASGVELGPQRPDRLVTLDILAGI